MQHVLRAVLLDPEAAAGIHLREPFLRYVALNRILHATSDDGTFPGLAYIAQFLLQQHVLSSPSVFNFYSPNFSPPGELGRRDSSRRSIRSPPIRRSSAARL